MEHATKDLGIWIDHANAFLTEFTVEPMSTIKIESSFTHQDKVSSMMKGEATSHHKEQHEQAAYYKQIAEIILGYDRILLFGPTDAKAALSNILKDDHHFDKIKIEVQTADKMTTYEQQLFVRNHFTIK